MALLKYSAWHRTASRNIKQARLPDVAKDSADRILHKDGFSQQDFEMIRPVVYSNTIHAILAVLRAMYQLNIEFSDSERQVRLGVWRFAVLSFGNSVPFVQKDAQIVYATVHAQRDTEPFSEDLSQAMQRLWADAGVRHCYSRNNEYQIDDSAK
ncbi:unnamed protein product [Soboliphyme baturini]|uniref:DUF2236 domain-containing protein n=1 Tax=Soboliphyme baturini TaxID=241478 RepID=A0A183J5S9_9BILA|nr:unnamed protein product [Soboliphyme baturini]